MGQHQARVRIKYRRSAWAGLARVVRWAAMAVLVLSLAAGAARYMSKIGPAGALDYTAHFLSIDTTAVGVLGTAAADIDDDGDIDVITAGKDGLKVYEQKDNLVFEAKIIDDKDSERVQVLDLNMDGSQDLLVTITDRQPSVRWYQNNGNLEFSGTNIGTGTGGKAYAGDVNADGSPDIITATTQGSVVVLERWMNNGSGSFTSTQLSSDSGVIAIGMGDVDGNGYLDVVTGGSKGVQRWGTSDGYSYGRLDIDDGNTGQSHLVVADVNKDSKLDVVAAEPAGNQVIYYRNVDQRSWQRIDIATSTDAVTVGVVDVDEDGDEDVVAAAQDDNTLVWLDNDGFDSFTLRTIASGLQSVFGVTAVDIDNDNDFDLVGGNHVRGTVYWYERVLARPVATAPGSVSQSTDGEGIVTFSTKVSDVDYDATRLRVQYSVDGTTWYKPWLTKVTPSSGTVNLKNSHGYQVGTTNAIDTDDNDSVTVSMEWDTQSAENTGGAIVGEMDSVQLRVIPRDGVGNGETQESAQFTVDNQAPLITSSKVESVTADSATLSWGSVIDSSSYTFKVHYGINAAEVLSQDSDSWDQDDDEGLADVDSRGTTITDLVQNTLYTFKLFVTDEYGNQTGLSSLRGTTTEVGASPVPSVTPEVSPSPGVTPTPIITPTVTPTSSPTVSPSIAPSPDVPLTNLPPVADAGADLVVNKDALVILDGTSSKDPEGASLTYGWRQVVGPAVELSSSNTATPSFTAFHEDESYVFALTVRDIGGLVSTDSVTVVSRPTIEQVVSLPTGTDDVVVSKAPVVVSSLLAPVNGVLLFLSVALVLMGTHGQAPIQLVKRFGGLLRRWRRKEETSGPHVLKVVDGQGGRVLPGVKMVIKDGNGKVWRKLQSNKQGEAKVTMPVGQYIVEIAERGYKFVPIGQMVPVANTDIVYGGGKLQVKSQDEQMSVIVPLKRTGEELGSIFSYALRVWQLLQKNGHNFTWPVLVAGAGLNTMLLLWVPQVGYLLIEVIYVALVLTKVAMDVRQTPSYGLVRDAISHVPLDLAVVRLYQEGTNKLVMTRATNAQGKFFALPPPGKYMMTVAKLGYATFTKHNVTIAKEQGTSIQMQTDLMPVIPKTQPLLIGAQ